MILMRTLHKDMVKYNEVDLSDESRQEETGWKVIHADVFRPPQYGGLLSVLVGTGCQVFAMTLLTLIFAVLGFLSPANRGALLMALLLLYVFMGILAGFHSAQTYAMFKGIDWKTNTLKTALLFPGLTFGVFFILNLLVWGEKSSGAVPFETLVALLALWFGISVPLVYLGSYLAQKKTPYTPPVKVSDVPRVRTAKESWYSQPGISILIGGVLPFGACFIEIFFIMSSVWLHQFYYVFGFLFIVFIILIITCAEISIVMCYFQLCNEDYHWWWRAYLTSGSSALYLFLYSAFYFSTRLTITKFVSGVLFFGYMSLVTLFFFVLTGTIGFFACFMFVHKIYSSIKID
jgi:transmembrane 9 superfamily protein 2/4